MGNAQYSSSVIDDQIMISETNEDTNLHFFSLKISNNNSCQNYEFLELFDKPISRESKLSSFTIQNHKLFCSFTKGSDSSFFDIFDLNKKNLIQSFVVQLRISQMVSDEKNNQIYLITQNFEEFDISIFDIKTNKISYFTTLENQRQPQKIFLYQQNLFTLKLYQNMIIILKFNFVNKFWENYEKFYFEKIHTNVQFDFGSDKNQNFVFINTDEYLYIYDFEYNRFSNFKLQMDSLRCLGIHQRNLILFKHQNMKVFLNFKTKNINPIILSIKMNLYHNLNHHLLFDINFKFR